MAKHVNVLKSPVAPIILVHSTKHMGKFRRGNTQFGAVYTDGVGKIKILPISDQYLGLARKRYTVGHRYYES